MLAASHIWRCPQMVKLWLLLVAVLLPSTPSRLGNVTLLLMTSIQVRCGTVVINCLGYVMQLFKLCQTVGGV